MKLRVFFDRPRFNQYDAALISEGSRKLMIPRVIEPRKFAQQGLSVAGEVPVEELLRLKGAVLELRQVSADLHFDVSESRHKVITGQLQSQVSMVCQRCLEAVETQLTSELALAMVWSEEDAKALPSTYEPWVVAEQGDLYEILEEELLLVLPLVAFHDYECVDRSLFAAGDAPLNEHARQNNPFHVLATLKGSSKT